MTSHNDTSRIAWLPAISGTGLCMGAIGLLCADAISSGHVTVLHLMQPLLVLGTVAAACLAHRSGWRRPGSTLAFALLAALGSLATIYGTLGRQADARDTRVGAALAENRTLQLRTEALDVAKADAARECKSGVGQKCTNASARVDALVSAMSSLRTVSPDPRGDAIADLLHLVVSADKAHTRAVVAAIDPLVLPLFLELGSILFFAVAFPSRKVRQELKIATDVAGKSDERVESCQPVWTREVILADLRKMKAVGAQRFLADRYGISEGQVSKVLKEFELAGHITRQRDGQSKMISIAPRR
jgi:hypothetical protein